MSNVKGMCCISNIDLTEAMTSQHTLNLLMEKGAPIIGLCRLHLSLDYKWYVVDNLKDLCTEFHWEPKD